MSRKMKQKNMRWLLIGGTALAVAVALCLWAKPGQPPDLPAEEAQESTIRFEEVQSAEIPLPHGLVLQDIGSYTGMYMEDGSNEILSNILMVTVRNDGDRTVQYAEILVSGEEETARFALTTLPPGQSVVLLEQNRMTYEGGRQVTGIEADNVALFPEEPSVHADKLEVLPGNGVLKVTNITGEDISGDIVIYYKNASSDMLYGGITYRVTIAGGLKAGETRQTVAGHCSAAGSRIMFITVG